MSRVADESCELSQVTLDKMMVYIAHKMPPGIMGTKLNQWQDVVARQLVVGLSGFVLSERAGEDVVLTLDRKIRPWWIPKWAWRRLKDETVTQTGTPKYIYPNAAIRVPELNEPMKFYHMTGQRSSVEDAK